MEFLALPTELQLAVFERCPVDSLIAFRSVCQSIHRLIDGKHRRHFRLLDSELNVIFDRGNSTWTFELTSRLTDKRFDVSSFVLKGKKVFFPVEYFACPSRAGVKRQNSIGLPMTTTLKDPFRKKFVKGIRNDQLETIGREFRFIHIQILYIFVNQEGEEHCPPLRLEMLKLFENLISDLQFSPRAFRLLGGDMRSIRLEDWRQFLTVLGRYRENFEEIELSDGIWPSYAYLLPSMAETGCLGRAKQSYYEARARCRRLDHETESIARLIERELLLSITSVDRHRFSEEFRAPHYRHLALSNYAKISAEQWIAIIEHWLANETVIRVPVRLRMLHVRIDYRDNATDCENLLAQICAHFPYQKSDSLMVVRADKSALLVIAGDESNLHVKVFALPETTAPNEMDLDQWLIRDSINSRTKRIPFLQRGTELRTRLVELGLQRQSL